MAEIVEDVLKIVREHEAPADGWSAILDLCRRSEAGVPWDAFPVPDVERDVEAATRCIQAEVSAEIDPRDSEDPCGIYLGLDTLNMEDGEGMNVAIAHARCSRELLETAEWAWEVDLQLGPDHLIRSLVEMHREYSKPEWEPAFDLCDYSLFLGYSGIVFVHAFARLTTTVDLYPVWGFHDGDLFTLGRSERGTFTRICT